MTTTPKRAAECVEGIPSSKRQVKDFTAVAPPANLSDESGNAIDVAMTNLSTKFANQCKLEVEADAKAAWDSCRKMWATTEKKGQRWSAQVGGFGLGATCQTRQKTGVIAFVKATVAEDINAMD